MLSDPTSLRNQIPDSDSEERCPVCSGPNRCRMVASHAPKGDCWCDRSSVPSPILRLVTEKFEAACLCQRCLDGLANYAQSSHTPGEILDLLYEEIRKDSTSPDFYYDQQGRTVFTAAYHLRRGHCCESNCRHCPYSFSR